MKATYFDFAAMLFSVLLLSAFVFQNGGSIKGTVSPIENAFRAFAILDKDTIKSNIIGGNFVLTNLRPGSYQLIIEAIPPYQHKLLTNIPVKEGESVNMGEIQLLLK
ncbi:carboxypeptidase-like regulatory domain-containing protein [Lacibacter sp.]|uniref:carboxypeptidase-like regulatory domain-containing protein n=1 Tax=Lacibacter sp. TaxID=1915409 RepID=UPI002B4B582E|nr:carboxypeptidase-like regulatory domain-containing protein [Lacibacter sp.]HLP39711.1 carboxypeptidase-like regulatory domain-containing protein [Lacibacter sp.]